MSVVEDRRDVERDIEETLGLRPEFLTAGPRAAAAERVGELTRRSTSADDTAIPTDDTAIPNNNKEMIGLAASPARRGAGTAPTSTRRRRGCSVPRERSHRDGDDRQEHHGLDTYATRSSSTTTFTGSSTRWPRTSASRWRQAHPPDPCDKAAAGPGSQPPASIRRSRARSKSASTRSRTSIASAGGGWAHRASPRAPSARRPPTPTIPDRSQSP